MNKDPSSFRDPSGFVFMHEGTLYRQINPSYHKQYHHLMNSGLYDELIKERLLVPHKEVPLDGVDSRSIIIKPKCIPFISYPYEWCFGEFKDAGIATLRIHLTALKYGMILKDASAYNIQFLSGYAVLIDTTSFEIYDEGKPWVAYGQFCRHFVAPLLLMSEVDQRMARMMQLFIDGIPLDIASNILKGRGRLFAKMHISLHSRAITKHETDGRSFSNNVKNVTMSKVAFTSLAENLLHCIDKLKIRDIPTEWGDYYKYTNYNEIATSGKEKIVSEFLDKCGKLRNVWDLGANDGRYSRIALTKGASVVSFDIDPVAVEKSYQIAKHNHEKLLALIFDLTTPSPSIGFANAERQSITGRQHPECIMMLAVVHHMAISNNLPLDMIASWLSKTCEYLIIEFVPKEDSQVQILLATRDDIFPDYNETGFEMAFCKYFDIISKEPVPDSKRTMYLYASAARRK